MEKQVFVIGDVHGCLEQLKQLLSQIDSSKTRVIMCGDLIDRGPDSRGVINFVRDNKIECVLGNHELMFIENKAYIERLVKDKHDIRAYHVITRSTWFYNGGEEVYYSYKGDYKQMLSDLEFLERLPVIIKTGVINEDNKELIVSHTLITNTQIRLDNNFDIDDIETMVWGRHNAVGVKNPSEYFNIHGHTPVDYFNKLKYLDGKTSPTPEFNKTYDSVNIDTGCPYNMKTRGVLTGIYFPSLEYKQVYTYPRNTTVQSTFIKEI